MRRKYWVVVANVVVLALVIGCRDSIVAPSRVTDSAPVSMMLVPSGAPAFSRGSDNFENGTTEFTVGPMGGIFSLGKHAIVFPANSICDPAKNDYGPTTWDKPCTVISKPITISAKIITGAGGTQSIDFAQHLRFVPSASAAGSVWLIMNTPSAKGSKGDLSSFAVLYAPAVGAAPVNDAAADPMLRTYVDTRTGISARIIRHFTGYMVGSGRACEPAPDNPDCIPVGGDPLAH